MLTQELLQKLSKTKVDCPVFLFEKIECEQLKHVSCCTVPFHPCILTWPGLEGSADQSWGLPQGPPARALSLAPWPQDST